MDYVAVFLGPISLSPELWLRKHQYVQVGYRTSLLQRVDPSVTPFLRDFASLVLDQASAAPHETVKSIKSLLSKYSSTSQYKIGGIVEGIEDDDSDEKH